MGKGILSIDKAFVSEQIAKVVKDILLLPDGFTYLDLRPGSCDYVIDFIFESDLIPDVTGDNLPEVMTVFYMKDNIISLKEIRAYGQFEGEDTETRVIYKSEI